ncbi:putative PHO91-similarity to Pho87p and Pho90p [Anopheles sinensis]|uniref:Putative PHO91-similarity to Pho87p and Pho90p n=1 Tax=Anopheles sinensis TaxID=74873 RepID=A0A084WPG3_ANOSI|nr:putative PHO91-similarity to Pho87p and Pho90p [Anopheles sinensis]
MCLREPIHRSIRCSVASNNNAHDLDNPVHSGADDDDEDDERAHDSIPTSIKSGPARVGREEACRTEAEVAPKRHRPRRGGDGVTQWRADYRQLCRRALGR